MKSAPLRKAWASAIGDAYQVDGAAITSNYRIEDESESHETARQAFRRIDTSCLPGGSSSSAVAVRGTGPNPNGAVVAADRELATVRAERKASGLIGLTG